MLVVHGCIYKSLEAGQEVLPEIYPSNKAEEFVFGFRTSSGGQFHSSWHMPYLFW